MDTNQPRVSLKNVIKIAGVWISYCIGSGFATGQDMMQYFVAYGMKGFIGILIGIAIHIYVTTSYMSLGKTMQFETHGCFRLLLRKIPGQAGGSADQWFMPCLHHRS